MLYFGYNFDQCASVLPAALFLCRNPAERSPVTENGIKALVAEIMASYERMDAIMEGHNLTEQDHAAAIGLVFEQWGMSEQNYNDASEFIQENLPLSLRRPEGTA